MICQHCGYCCIMLDVVIIHPLYAKEDFDLSKVNTNNTLFKVNNQACPHLTFDNGKYLCSIHDMPWYSETPCFSHIQAEATPDTPCRTGIYMLKNKDLRDKLKLIYNESKLKEEVNGS